MLEKAKEYLKTEIGKKLIGAVVAVILLAVIYKRFIHKGNHAKNAFKR